MVCLRFLSQTRLIRMISNQCTCTAYTIAKFSDAGIGFCKCMTVAAVRFTRMPSKTRTLLGWCLRFICTQIAALAALVHHEIWHLRMCGINTAAIEQRVMDPTEVQQIIVRVVEGVTVQVCAIDHTNARSEMCPRALREFTGQTFSGSFTRRASACGRLRRITRQARAFDVVRASVMAMNKLSRLSLDIAMPWRSRAGNSGGLSTAAFTQAS